MRMRISEPPFVAPRNLRKRQHFDSSFRKPLVHPFGGHLEHSKKTYKPDFRSDKGFIKITNISFFRIEEEYH